MRKLKSLKVLPFKPGVGQYIAMHATITARDIFLANFYPSGPFTCIFFQNLFRVFPALAVAYTGSCVARRIKQVTMLDAGSRAEYSLNINWLQNIYHCVSGFAF